jgi:signal transduction histidine kinase
MIGGDHHQLCQVFTNLLTNAFEALDGRGRVVISAAVDAVEHDPAFAQEPFDAAQGRPLTATRVMVVEVADDGPGVPAELNDRIFDPFFTTKPQGSGLGLPIVRKIVDAHDGRIDLSSAPGQGTRFRVTLPVTTGSSWFK